MSFGYSIGDGLALVQLAYRVYQGARQACGEHDDLTREVASLHKVLERLQRELANPESLLNRADDDRRSELDEHGRGCESVLKVMDAIVTKYNELADKDKKKRGKKLWQKVKFGNGEMRDLTEIRIKLSTYTTAINMSLNLCSLGSQGRVEKELNDVGVKLGGSLEGIRVKVDWIAANMTARSGDGTVWTSYENDDREFWRQLRRELVKEGYRSSVLHKHKGLLKSYVAELGQRGVFDQVAGKEEDQAQEQELMLDRILDNNSAEESLRNAREELEKSSGEEDARDSRRKLHTAEAVVESEEEGGGGGGGGDTKSDEALVLIPSSRNEDSSLTVTMIPTAEIASSPNLDSKLPQNVTLNGITLPVWRVIVEEIIDEDFLANAHPNCFAENQPTLETEGNTGAAGGPTPPTSPAPLNRVPVNENSNRDFVWAISNFEVPRTSSIKGTDYLEREWKRRQKAVFRVFEALLQTHIIFEAPNKRIWLIPVKKIMTWETLKDFFTSTFPKSEVLGLFTPSGNGVLLSAGWQRAVADREDIYVSPETCHEIVQPGALVQICRRTGKLPYNLLSGSFDMFASSSNPSALLWPTLHGTQLNRYLQLVLPVYQHPMAHLEPISVRNIQSVLFPGQSFDIPEDLVANSLSLDSLDDECIYKDNRLSTTYREFLGPNQEILFYARANRENRKIFESGCLTAAEYDLRKTDSLGGVKSKPESSAQVRASLREQPGQSSIDLSIRGSSAKSWEAATEALNRDHLPMPARRRRGQDQEGTTKKKKTTRTRKS